MLAATMLLIQANAYRIGFGSLHGFWYALLGFVCWMIVLWGVFAIFKILMAKFSNDETAWMWQIARVVLIVIVSLAFIQLIFNVFPM